MPRFETTEDAMRYLLKGKSRKQLRELIISLAALANAEPQDVEGVEPLTDAEREEALRVFKTPRTPSPPATCPTCGNERGFAHRDGWHWVSEPNGQSTFRCDDSWHTPSPPAEPLTMTATSSDGLATGKAAWHTTEPPQEADK